MFPIWISRAFLRFSIWRIALDTLKEALEDPQSRRVRTTCHRSLFSRSLSLSFSLEFRSHSHNNNINDNINNINNNKQLTEKEVIDNDVRLKNFNQSLLHHGPRTTSKTFQRLRDDTFIFAAELANSVLISNDDERTKYFDILTPPSSSQQSPSPVLTLEYVMFELGEHFLLAFHIKIMQTPHRTQVHKVR